MSALAACRICGNTSLVTVLDLGAQALTGAFPRPPETHVAVSPLVLVKCHGEGACGLVQLAHTYDLGKMYGEGYGYRSSLNRSMVRHLAAKVEALRARRPVGAGDVVLDIGSNDGTTLAQYPAEVTRIGVDPTAAKFASYYQPGIQVAAEFFNALAFERLAPGKKARVVTSIAMFYDLPAPMDFVRDVARVLADDGIWHFEQSYLPSMLETNSYDTVCHEHLEYYGLRQIHWMTRRAGLRIIDVQLNDVNGGSFAVTVEKGEGDAPIVDEMIAKEDALGLHTLAPYEAFAARAERHRVELPALLEKLKAEGKKVLGLGASTKGNVVLQYCGIGPDLLPAIAEVNADKFGCVTPGTLIPIVSEDEARAEKPDVLMVLPWHFRKTFSERERPFLAGGGELLFPLPEIELAGAP
ncbi:MAG: class I SAM-dependent methyltransferase [Labilithrix sp.]|nr:class I SAM-dependent methyltransferase [Labilithrix sp.]MCW5816957.1 class I SAM-dependent methyltransferase [Labilithrix sp.]